MRKSTLKALTDGTIHWLTVIVNAFDSSLFFRHVFFALATFFVLIITGYYFGTFDQASHIPFLAKSVDPSLFPNDLFFDLRLSHYSYFWRLFYPFYKLGILEISMFVVYLCVTYLTFWSVWRLTKTLFNNTLTSFFTVVAFIFPHLGFAAFGFFEFSLLNRTFVFPFLLLAIDLYLRKKFVFSFLLLGVLYNLHAISVHFALFMFVVAGFFQIRSIGVKNALLSLGAFFLCASPIFYWKFGHSSVDFTLRPEWFSLLSQSLMYSVFFPLSTKLPVLLLTASGVSSAILFFIARSHLPFDQKTRTVTYFVLASLFLVCLEVVVSFWFPVTIIIQSQIVRAGLFVFLFGLLYFIHLLVTMYKSKKLSESSFLLQSVTIISSPLLFASVLVWILQGISHKTLRYGLCTLVLFLTFVSAGYMSYSYGIWRPGIHIHIFPEKSNWYEVQTWARTATPRDAFFLTPPHVWGFYDLEWRVGSERSTLVTLAELLEAAFEPSYIASWDKRFTLAAPSAKEQFRGDFRNSLAITKKAYYSLTESDIIGLARQYPISYVVFEKPYHLNLPVAYENATYTVYDVGAITQALVLGK